MCPVTPLDALFLQSFVSPRVSKRVMEASDLLIVLFSFLVSELQKFLGAIFIGWDIELYDEVMKTFHFDKRD